MLANTVANISVIIYEGDTAIYGSFFYWIAAISYALQIYFDFSGYSDMAIGLGKFLASIFLKTLIIHTPLCPLRNFGEDGIFRFPLGFETIFISPWEAIALEKHGIFSIF